MDMARPLAVLKADKLAVAPVAAQAFRNSERAVFEGFADNFPTLAFADLSAAHKDCLMN